MALIEALIGKIGALVLPPLKNKLERNEIVIQLLKQFNLDPAHPPRDFTGVYAYTLVEYGVGKPTAALELFRHDDIRQAFRRAFEQDDLAILLRESEHFLDWNIVGDEVRKLGIDPRREFASFSVVFHQVVDRTRVPAEVRQDQKLNIIYEDLHHQTGGDPRTPRNIRRTQSRACPTDAKRLGALAARHSSCGSGAAGKSLVWGPRLPF